ncbi:Hypothetical predicted protein [Mytilus galloprovincialis]|uniref:Reverse transcriptase domain-containing protein n=1 Tax=Mytilus galloprovincialis TaxID=29158 RepID=A0A8B6CSL5_MYTGA|nr:Hypothetical predicted protein [Mytilus galloprovincialis]
MKLSCGQCAQRPQDWDKYLGPALFAYREVPQESVLFAPYELVYGWPVRGPMTSFKELWTREITDPDVRSTFEYVINLRERLESTCELVKQNLEKASLAKETLRDVHINEALKANETVKVQCLLDKFSHVLTDIPGRTNVLQHDIKLTSDDPVRFKPYPISYAMLDTVNKEVDKMIEMNIIERSDSPYSSPFLIVKKKDQSNRFCIDFRGLNSITIFDAETIGNIEEIFSKLSGYQFKSKIDLTKVDWQISLVDAAKLKTAFQTPRGLFQFKVLPFGLFNRGDTFVRCMRKVLEGLENVDNFVDDIIVYTLSFNHNMEVLESVFVMLASANLSARPSKYYIAYSSLEVLGHIV